MQRRAISAADAPRAIGYARAVEVSAATRTLYVSGQIPVDANGQCPGDFDGQCRLAWRNVLAQLAAADMNLTNLVKVTIYLADRRFELYNLADDIGETNNLANNMPDKLTELAQLMQNWIDRTNAQLSIDKNTGEEIESPSTAATHQTGKLNSP